MPTIKLVFDERISVNDNMIRAFNTLNWAFGKLSSKNVKRLDTNETVIKSANGETYINGPVLEQSDINKTVRLKQGLDLETLLFIFRMWNAAGQLTVDIDSDGNLVIENGTFKGILTITGGQVKTIIDTLGAHFINQVGGGTSNTEKITIYVEYDGNGNIKFTDNTGTKHAYIFMSDTAFGINSDLNMTITVGSGKRLTLPAETWLSGETARIASENWVSFYFQTKISGASGSFKTGDTPQKTVTVSNGIITSII